MFSGDNIKNQVQSICQGISRYWKQSPVKIKLSTCSIECVNMNISDFPSSRDEREMMMLEEHAANGNNYVSPFSHPSMFFPHQSSPMNASGPDRFKLQSYRSSPYSYSQTQRKSSPIESNHFVLLIYFLVYLTLHQLSSKTRKKKTN